MIPAIVLAAGLSRRMGRFKLTLPWRETTVIGQVIATLEAAGVTEIVVVTGNRAQEVKTALSRSLAHVVYNPHYAAGEMLSSIQAGLRAIAEPPTAEADRLSRRQPAPSRPDEPSAAAPPLAALLCLGDQPQMEVATVAAVLAAGAVDGWRRIVIPSYRMRAGHPILLPAWLWPEILACTGTLRDVLTAHRDATRYLVVDTPTVLADLDTPEDYKAGSSKRQQVR